MTDGPFRRLLGLARRAAADPTDDNRLLARFAAGGDASGSSEPFDAAAHRELCQVLDEELDRLPERFRRAVVLCYLEGTTTEEAARRLGCPRGTVLSRLAAARAKLRARLSKRGVA